MNFKVEIIYDKSDTSTISTKAVAELIKAVRETYLENNDDNS
jgi:hypothetical protein